MHGEKRIMAFNAWPIKVSTKCERAGIPKRSRSAVSIAMLSPLPPHLPLSWWDFALTHSGDAAVLLTILQTNCFYVLRLINKENKV